MIRGKGRFHVVYGRLFNEDVKAIRDAATKKGSTFQTELRMLVHEAVRGRSLGLKLLK